MFKTISHSQKLKLLGAGLLLLIILCYRFAFSLTIDQYHEYKSYNPKTEEDPTELVSEEKLKENNKQLDVVLSHFELDSVNENKNLLLITSKYCQANRINLKEYRPFHLSSVDSLQILTRLVEIEGDFEDCLKFVYQLELLENTGRISSVEFKSFTDPLDKKVKLSCILYVQNLIGYEQEKK